jgi:putative ABC transport system permease protein
LLRSSGMIKNYFKTAWRNLVRNKVYSVLNIFGLSVGMTVALLIGLWVHYQYSYDRWLPGYQRSYQVWMRMSGSGGGWSQPATALPMGAAIRREVPGVEYVARADWFGSRSLISGDKKLYLRGAMAEEDFLKIFPFPMAQGNGKGALTDPGSIVLTQSTAKSLFGKADPVGKTVRVDNSYSAIVSGVLNDLPGNSTLQFDFIVPLSHSLQAEAGLRKELGNWRNNSWQTFVSLRPGVSYAQVEPLLSRLLKDHDPEDYKIYKFRAFLHPLKDWHLYSDFREGGQAGGFIDYVRMFSVIGALVLLIACINFMNLSTARSERRSREVGIRKAIGSQRRDLIIQFLCESFAITFLAFLFCLLISALALPAFNTLAGTGITIPWSSWVFWVIMAGYIVLTGLLAGSRPAFYLSSFHPVKVLKGVVRTDRTAVLSRKALVVLQFSCSVALIISTIIIYQQIQHTKDRPLGYDPGRLLMTDASSDLNKNYSALKQELLASGVVTDVTRSSSPVTDIWSYQRIDNWQGKQPGESLDLATVAVSDADYFKTMKMRLIKGTSWTGNPAADSLMGASVGAASTRSSLPVPFAGSVILNEAAVERMRFKEPISQVITWHDVPQRVRVVGVVGNSLMASPFMAPVPTIFIYDPGWANSVAYRLAPGIGTQAAITRLTGIFNKYNPAYPYIYKFAETSYASKFTLENLIGNLSGLFAGLAIFISCLGLFGLAAYMAEQRTKEIGIRKVLGASVLQVWLLLSRDFIALVLVSCIIASPVAFYFLHNWLLKYEYRITIGPLVFVAAAFAAVLITVITVSFRAIRAALANPTNSLHSE